MELVFLKTNGHSRAQSIRIQNNSKSLGITGAATRANEQKMGDFKTLLQCNDRLTYTCPLCDEVVATI